MLTHRAGCLPPFSTSAASRNQRRSSLRHCRDDAMLYHGGSFDISSGSHRGWSLRKASISVRAGYYLSLVHQLSHALLSINRTIMSDGTASAYTSDMGTGSSIPTRSTTTGPPKPSQSTSFHIFNDGGSNFGLRVPEQYTYALKPDWYLQQQNYAFDVARSLGSQISGQDALESKVQSLCDRFSNSHFSLKPTNVSFERLEPKDFKFLQFPKNVMKLDLEVTDLSSEGAVTSTPTEGSKSEGRLPDTAGTPSMSATSESQTQ